MQTQQGESLEEDSLARTPAGDGHNEPPSAGEARSRQTRSQANHQLSQGVRQIILRQIATELALLAGVALRLTASARGARWRRQSSCARAGALVRADVARPGW
jgi:hypothetical protein